MQRIGQPAVIGQLLAGIILGPSVFGAIWPAGQQAIFPPNSSDRQMLNAVSDFGVLLLLLLTGMETDLALVKRVRRIAAITSAAGIVIPFGCGYVLGEMLPDSVLPAAVAGLLSGSLAVRAYAASTSNHPGVSLQTMADAQKPLPKHACEGQNDCKGQGGGKNLGKNSCKGKGGCATDGSKPQ